MQRKPYFPISQYYRQRFAEKVYKISVSVASGCPNRRYTGDPRACIFCDEYGSAAYHLEVDKPLIEQIRRNREKIARRYRAQKFLVYFQAYTNTLTRLKTLQQWLDIALSEPGVVGVVLGTRPDCLPKRLLDYLHLVSRDHFVQLELGVQCFDDAQLKFLRRGHSRRDNLLALEKLSALHNIHVALHLIFGLPGESEQSLIEMAQLINQHRVDSVKLHQLHVLKNTPLETIYRDGGYQPLNLDDYAERVITFLRYLRHDIAIQRLSAVASRWDDLLAPEWSKYKRLPAQKIETMMNELCVSQGDRIDTSN